MYYDSPCTLPKAYAFLCGILTYPLQASKRSPNPRCTSLKTLEVLQALRNLSPPQSFAYALNALSMRSHVFLKAFRSCKK